MSDESDFTFLPEGTRVTLGGRWVEIQFPSSDDAIVFHEFIRSVVNGTIKLEAVHAEV